MKLLVAGVSWPPESFLRNRLEGLARRGLHVTVASAAPRGQARAHRLEGVNVLRLPHWDDPPPLTVWRVLWDGAMAPGRWLAAASAARSQWARFPGYAALARLRPDVVHFEWNSAAIDYWPLADVWRCPVVISCRGSQIQVRPHAPGREDFVRGLERTLRRATAVHCVSEAIREEAARYGLEHAKAHVIRPAVDPEFFLPAAKRRADDGVFRVVSTGSLHWVKGYEYALAAVRRLTGLGVPVQFDILGDGRKAEGQRLQYTILDLGLEPNVRLRGSVDRAAVRSALHEADAFLLASVSEGISNAVLEAMACGIPVVTTGCGGMREAVTDGVEGFVVPVRNPAALAAALARLARDRELRERMGGAGRERILHEFTMARQIEEFESLYAALAQ